MHTMLKIAGLLICALLIYMNTDPSVGAIRALPDTIYISDGEEPQCFGGISEPYRIVVDGVTEVGANLSETLSAYATGAADERHERSITIELFGIKIKEVTLNVREDIFVMPGGDAIGVTMYMSGALVVGLGSVDTDNGRMSPAAAAGLQAGDVIIAVDGKLIDNATHLMELCKKTDGGVTLEAYRGGERMSIYVEPVCDASDGAKKLGMWVRDSTAGIGTLSFYVMSDLSYGALGHAVTDVDTGSLLSVKSGSILSAKVVDVTVGASGTPGEIRGTFGTLSKKLGSIDKNCIFGIYGTLSEARENKLYPHGLPLAYPDEAKLGAATLLTTVDEGGIKEYDCEIVKLYEQDEPATKGMVVKITDDELIDATGGIVQGMSGSPLIQNGKLIGAVTHVFIGDPLKGYCVYGLWMLKECMK